MDTAILRIAVPSPLYQSFDYLAPADTADQLRPGVRIRVPFGRQRTVGVFLQRIDTTDVPRNKLKQIDQVLDATPLLTPELLQLASWSSRYYHYPLGEVLATLLPPALRRGDMLPELGIRRWRLTAAGKDINPVSLGRAPKQLALWNQLHAVPEGLAVAQVNEPGQWRSALAALIKRGWAEDVTENDECVPWHSLKLNNPPLTLNPAQQAAVNQICDNRKEFFPILLNGVTGSGKTEVYLQTISAILADGRQVLVLVPEIGLTPQLILRFRDRFAVPVAVLHSNLSDQERVRTWLQARTGELAIVIGTRLAVFTPFENLGLIVVDEEHDTSFKQQEGFRYHGRDVALVRAKNNNIPIVLGSATPSFESLLNADRGRLQSAVLPQRAGDAHAPSIEILDVRGLPKGLSLSPRLLERMHAELAASRQVMVFLNRRGYAPTLLCHACGWLAQCPHCDARYTLHLFTRQLRCHHCDHQAPQPHRCPKCLAENLIPLGVGTERIGDELARHFPNTPIIRIDRDTTRRKGSFDDLLKETVAGQNQILVGTQMLAKGHHFPNVSLVVIADIDHGLFCADFRATERMAQLITQVAGRAGRAQHPGHVVIQTHLPEHPLLQQLARDGYGAFAESALAERRLAQMPPYSFLALLRADAKDRQLVMDFLEQAKQQLPKQARGTPVLALGPVPAPMERRAGRFRAQLLLQSDQRGALQAALDDWTPNLARIKTGGRIRWSLDVDPVELY